MDHRAVDPPYKNTFYEPESGGVLMKKFSGVLIAKTKLKGVSKLALVKNWQ